MSEVTAPQESVSLWDDNPSEVDLLGFSGLIAPVLTAIEAGDLDPLTIGIHGPWGSGKSTVLRLLEGQLREKDDIVVIATSPWEYEDHDDVKGLLVGIVLEAVEGRAKGQSAWARRAKRRIANLGKRVDWVRVGRSVAKASLSMGTNVGEVVEALSLRPIEPRSMVGFRREFGELMSQMEGVRRVVVLIDDLDRCLPRAVVPTLEAVKLFLSVPKMVFVIAAAKDLVTDAIAAYLPESNRAERIASHYLEKIVQLPISLPRIPDYDAEAYIGLLLAGRQGGADAEGLKELAAHCDSRRLRRTIPLLHGVDEGARVKPEEATLRLSAQIALGLGAEICGNPRMMKRFLNAFGVRRYIAEARGIEIGPRVLAKLMILEERYMGAFQRLASLEPGEREGFLARWEAWARSGDVEPPEVDLSGTKAWAASEPSLASEDIGPYLTLAASLASTAVRVLMSEELAAIVRRMVGGSGADRELACEEALNRSGDERRLILEGLYEQMRTAEDVSASVEALVKMARGDAALGAEIAEAVGSLDRRHFTPAIAVTIARSSVPELEEVARGLAVDPRVEPGTKAALEEVLA